MTMNDELVAEYLAAVDRAAADIPPSRRQDLLADLREHIAAARAELDPETEAGIRTILDRLGDPAVIATAARLDLTPPPAPPVPQPIRPGAAAARRGPGIVGRILIAVVAAFVLFFVVCAVGLLAYRTAGGGPRTGPVTVVTDAHPPSRPPG